MDKSYIVDMFTYVRFYMNNQIMKDIETFITSITWKGSIFSVSYLMNFEANKKLSFDYRFHMKRENACRSFCKLDIF